jgi:hypothetical protein
LTPVAFPALACDYDGTLAMHDRIPPATLRRSGARGRRPPPARLLEERARRGVPFNAGHVLVAPP